MSETMCNFFRFLNCVLDPPPLPNRGQNSCMNPAVGKIFFKNLSKVYLIWAQIDKHDALISKLLSKLKSVQWDSRNQQS